MIKNVALKHILVLIALSYAFLMLGNGVLELTNPDEVFYTQTAKEMVEKGTWSVPYLFGQPQFEKPIFTYWSIRAAFLMFGVTAFAARFFPALFGMIGVLAVYWLGLTGFADKKKAFIAALILMSGGLYIGLSRTVFTDMIFSVFILLAMASFFWGYAAGRKKTAGLVLFFMFSGLAVLTKGPLGIALPLISVLLFLAVRRELKFFFCRGAALGLLLFSVIAVPWYAAMIRQFGDTFIQEFFYNDHIRRILEAEHTSNDTWFFYPLSALLCMFPWTFYVAIALFYFFGKLRGRNCAPIYQFLFTWVFVILAGFQAAHSKLVSYIFPLFPALALLAADFIHSALSENKTRTLLALSIISCSTILAVPIGLLVAMFRFSEYVPSRVPVYCFIFFYLIFFGVMLFLLKRKRFLVNIYLLAVQIPLILVFVFLNRQSLNIYASSRAATQYLLTHEQLGDNKLLCAKFLARGVRFYTDKDVAVIDMGGSNFFSPHPVPYLNTYEKLGPFLKEQGTTYGVLTHSSLEAVKDFAKNGYKVDELYAVGDEYVVKISAI